MVGLKLFYIKAVKYQISDSQCQRHQDIDYCQDTFRVTVRYIKPSDCSTLGLVGSAPQVTSDSRCVYYTLLFINLVAERAIPNGLG